MKHWCSVCGRSTRSGSAKGPYSKYYCEDGRVVDPHATCDRWIHVVQDREFYQKVRESIKRMEPYREGTYEIHRLPPVGTNYRILK